MTHATRYTLIAALVIILGAGFFLMKGIKAPTPTASQPPIPYQMANASDGTIRRLFTGLGPITRIKFTPDGNYMLVALLSGEVKAFHRDGTTWEKQAKDLLKIETNFPGFPPEENGLTGIAFGADYATSGDLFFSYTAQAGEKDFKNRVSRATIKETSGQLAASDLVQIWEGNTPASSSHQMQAINGVMIAGKPHVMFQDGEGFEADRSKDPTKEGGKMMVVQRDGSDPLGPRPFPANPRIQVTGLRNPPDFEINTLDKEQRIGIVDTGPDRFDRFIYGKVIDLIGNTKVKGLELGWDGNATPSLSDDRLDPNMPGNPNTVIFRWDPTHTATNLVFHPGKGVIPAATATQVSVLVDLFGPTGEKGLDDTGKPRPGREIWLGKLSLGDKPAVTWSPFITLTSAGIDALTHPIGLERDPITNDLMFADIIDGSLYSVELTS